MAILWVDDGKGGVYLDSGFVVGQAGDDADALTRMALIWGGVLAACDKRSSSKPLPASASKLAAKLKVIVLRINEVETLLDELSDMVDDARFNDYPEPRRARPTLKYDSDTGLTEYAVHDYDTKERLDGAVSRGLVEASTAAEAANRPVLACLRHVRTVDGELDGGTWYVLEESERLGGRHVRRVYVAGGDM